MLDTPAADAYFQGAKYTKEKKAGSYIVKAKDLKHEGFDAIIVMAFSKDI